jgi:hypothetical protein
MKGQGSESQLAAGYHPRSVAKCECRKPHQASLVAGVLYLRSSRNVVAALVHEDNSSYRESKSLQIYQPTANTKTTGDTRNYVDSFGGAWGDWGGPPAITPTQVCRTFTQHSHNVTRTVSFQFEVVPHRNDLVRLVTAT